MRFKTVRNIGLGMLLLIVALMSILSYMVMSDSAQKLEHVITVEGAKLKKWHSLLEMITHAKDSLFAYHMGRSEVIAPVDLFIEKALQKVGDVKKLAKDEEELTKAEYLTKELTVFRQAVYAYGQEIRDGYKSGTSAKEMESIALYAADNIAELIHSARDDVNYRIEVSNKDILNTTKTSSQILGISLIVFILFTVLTVVIMNRALARPIHELAQATRRVIKGDLTQNINVNSNDEIGELGKSFNFMMRELKSTTVSRDTLAMEVAERKRAEEALQESETRFRAIATSTNDLLWEGDIRNNRLDWFGDIDGLLGYEKGEFPQTISGHMERVHPDDLEQFENEVKEALKGRQNFKVQYRIRTREGTYRYWDESARAIGFENGKAVKWVGAISDITERKVSEEKLKQAYAELERSNSELQQFAYVSSHDLREPLRMVTSYLQLLERRYKGRLDADAGDFIRYAVDGATRMNRLILDLLTYSRVHTRGREFTLVDSTMALQNALDNLSVAIEESSAVVTHDPLPSVAGDETQLLQLFQNLIGNSLKFRGDKAPRIHVSFEDRADERVFSVSDNGIGIESEYSDRIFGIFQRLHNNSKYPGTGIGLAVCKKIVEHHGGRIWMESRPDKGTTFNFTISNKGGEMTGNLMRNKTGELNEIKS